jgi:hypothetical protein
MIPRGVGGQKSICTAWLDFCPPTPSGEDQEQVLDHEVVALMEEGGQGGEEEAE